MNTTGSLYRSPLDKIPSLKPASPADQARLQKPSADPRPHPLALSKARARVERAVLK